MDSNHPLFENPHLEKFSKSNAVFVISSLFVLAGTIFSIGVVGYSISIPGLTGWFLTGFLIFSLIEYLIHRYVFHSGNYREKKNWQSKLHGIHHERPAARERLTLPMSLALGVSLNVFLIFKLLMGNFAFGFFPGFITGYALYLLVHFWIHTRKAPKNQLKVLWRNHHIHHHVDDGKAFGVTSPFWDWVFGTLP